MGLDTTHDAFHGAYSAFNRFRQSVAKAMGGSFPPHQEKGLDDSKWYWGDGYGEQTHPGLYLFLKHSDCDGELSPEECELVATDLEAILPVLEKEGEGSGHILNQGGYAKVCQKFIKGCRLAAQQNETLYFE